MLEALRWVVPATIPAALAVGLVLRTQLRKDPRALAVSTFVLGGVAGAASLTLTALASRASGLDLRSSVVGEEAALLFLFCLVAPLGEVTKVVAIWPAFRSHRFTDPYHGVLYG